MASTSEIGHTRNIAHFQSLITFCTGYGVPYNPTNNAIKITNMQAKLADAQAAMSQVSTTNTTYQNAVNARLAGFADLKKRATRVINALLVSGASAETIADAKTINRKIQGKRASSSGSSTPPPKEGDTPAKDPVSASQQSYDKLIEHLSNLIELLSQEPLYTPNEADLKLTALQTFRDSLITLNTAVITTYAPVSNDRIARDAVMYTPTTGLVDIAITSRNYIKAIYGSTSPQYAQVKSLEFKNLLRK